MNNSYAKRESAATKALQAKLSQPDIAQVLEQTGFLNALRSRCRSNAMVNPCEVETMQGLVRHLSVAGQHAHKLLCNLRPIIAGMQSKGTWSSLAQSGFDTVLLLAYVLAESYVVGELQAQSALDLDASDLHVPVKNAAIAVLIGFIKIQGEFPDHQYTGVAVRAGQLEVPGAVDVVDRPIQLRNPGASSKVDLLKSELVAKLRIYSHAQSRGDSHVIWDELPRKTVAFADQIQNLFPTLKIAIEEVHGATVDLILLVEQSSQGHFLSGRDARDWIHKTFRVPTIVHGSKSENQAFQSLENELLDQLTHIVKSAPEPPPLRSSPPVSKNEGTTMPVAPTTQINAANGATVYLNQGDNAQFAHRDIYNRNVSGNTLEEVNTLLERILVDVRGLPKVCADPELLKQFEKELGDLRAIAADPKKPGMAERAKAALGYVELASKAADTYEKLKPALASIKATLAASVPGLLDLLNKP